MSNIIFSGKGNDSLFGGFGFDQIFGGGGDDYIIGYGFGPGNPSSQPFYGLSETGRDILDGGAGDDYLGGGGGDDILIGGTGNDVLAGSRGKDILYGGAGDDILRPGDDADILWGGSGADTFRYSYSVNAVESPDADGGRDVIMDFEVGIDKLDLRGYSVKPEDLDITKISQGLLLSFEFLGREFDLEVRGLTAFQPGDIIFS
ncbi:hypothetical protein BKE38_26545 [Pseudoroseomonas deserti]|uniref:Peptidase M10 serralysin C-terminal domain-containing protein n=1 Tax=Teichococcus deserti TaxID=1817963 RepID=A0A1V2GUN7_9PROT|nr:hypothetical protein BKE38_26545 [Pseudoroseomonas deserti]